MKIAIGLVFSLLAASAMADQAVRGYFRSDGTYVAPHYRSSPDRSRSNNFSSQGNVNPYTGQRGYVNPYSPPVQPTYRIPQPSNPYYRPYGR